MDQGIPDFGPQRVIDQPLARRVSAGKPLSPVLHFLGFHRGEPFLACGNGFHGFIDRCQCKLAGQFRFLDGTLRRMSIMTLLPSLKSAGDETGAYLPQRAP